MRANIGNTNRFPGGGGGGGLITEVSDVGMAIFLFGIKKMLLSLKSYDTIK